MSKGLEALKSFKSFTHEDDYIIENKTWKKVLIDNELKEKYDIIEKELTLSQDLLGHVTDLYKKKELDYYADREPFYYDYYIVFDTIPLKVSEELYDKVREQLDLPNKCWER